MDLIEELKTWKTDLEALAIEKGKADGRLEQAMADLKALGFDSVEQAQAKVDMLIREKEQATEKAQDLLKTLKETYAEFIE